MIVLENGIYRDITKVERVIYEQKASLEMKIKALKQQLADTDYKAIKYAEGLIDEVDYQPIRLQRQLWRNEINQLELEIKEG